MNRNPEKKQPHLQQICICTGEPDCPKTLIDCLPLFWLAVEFSETRRHGHDLYFDRMSENPRVKKELVENDSATIGLPFERSPQVVLPNKQFYAEKLLL